MRLSDAIEQFIKTMLAQDEHEVELKRNELAEYFGCAPSQINYVLSTRFAINLHHLADLVFFSFLYCKVTLSPLPCCIL